MHLTSLSLLFPRRSNPDGHTSPSARAVHRAVAAFQELKVKEVIEDANTKAARTLQKAWRHLFKFRTTARYVKQMLVVNSMTSDYAKSISFETLVNHLKEKKVILAAKHCMHRVHLVCSQRHGVDADIKAGNVNVRVILAAFMIVHRPSRVFEQLGSVEHGLVESAKKMLQCLESILGFALKAGKDFAWATTPKELTEDFQDVVFRYLKDFKAWKVPDEAKLSARIQHALVALYQAKGHLPATEPADSRLMVEFESQIARLRGKLAQIAGQGALDLFDQQRLGCTGPWAVGGGGDGNGGNGSVVAVGRVGSMESRMTNEQLAHELLLDPLFQLMENGAAASEHPTLNHIRKSFHRAFWESVIDDMLLPTPCYARICRVLEEVREGVCDLAGEEIREQANDILDTEHIKTRVQNGAFGWDDCKSLVGGAVGLIRTIQTPRREEDIQAKWAEIGAGMDAAVTAEIQARSFTVALEFLLDRVNLCRVDAANARLRLIAPVIKDHGLDYERGKFEDKVRAGTITKDRTEQWISSTLKTAMNLVDKVKEGSAGELISTHALAVTLLVDGSIIPDDSNITAETVPETMALDIHRIQSMRQEFRCLTDTSISLIVASTDRSVFTSVAEHLNCMHAGETVEPEQLPMSDEMKRTLKISLAATSPLNKIIRARLSDTLRTNIVEKKARNTVTPLTTPHNIQQRIDGLIRQAALVASINRKVHEFTYNEMMPRVATAIAGDA